MLKHSGRLKLMSLSNLQHGQQLHKLNRQAILLSRIKNVDHTACINLYKKLPHAKKSCAVFQNKLCSRISTHMINKISLLIQIIASIYTAASGKNCIQRVLDTYTINISLCLICNIRDETL